MPIVLRINGYRFFFFSNENNEPLHVHVEKGDGTGKIWIEPNVIIEYCYDFTVKQQKEIIQIASENIELIKKTWDEHFKNS